jgi:hypothetical protein
VLRNNGGNPLAINSNARFNFAGTVNFGSAYDLSVSSEPVAQTCRFGIAPSTINATGTVSGDVSVPITCQTKTYSISGNVSGLAASAQGVLELTGLSISTQTFTFTSNAAFTFTNRISHGQSYAVTVKQQPVGQTCVVGGAANGTIGANVSNLTVSCANSAPIFYTVGGTVSGVPNLANISLVMTSTDNVANGQAANGLTNGAYQFLTTVQGGSQFSIAATTPGGVTWTCAVQNGFGQTTTISANVSNADVICTGGSGSGGSGGNGGSGGSGGTGPWTVTVAVTGIDSGESVGLQLLAGSINESQSFSNSGPFQFTNLVPDQTAITVNLQTSPAGKTCQAFAPSTVTGANRNVAVNCSSGSGGNGGGIPVIP